MGYHRYKNVDKKTGKVTGGYNMTKDFARKTCSNTEITKRYYVKSK
jgi:hypothetical protein